MYGHNLFYFILFLFYCFDGQIFIQLYTNCKQTTSSKSSIIKNVDVYFKLLLIIVTP